MGQFPQMMTPVRNFKKPDKSKNGSKDRSIYIYPVETAEIQRQRKALKSARGGGDKSPLNEQHLGARRKLKICT